jgi:hypothetical protein
VVKYLVQVDLEAYGVELGESVNFNRVDVGGPGLAVVRAYQGLVGTLIFPLLNAAVVEVNATLLRV